MQFEQRLKALEKQIDGGLEKEERRISVLKDVYINLLIYAAGTNERLRKDFPELYSELDLREHTTKFYDWVGREDFENRIQIKREELKKELDELMWREKSDRPWAYRASGDLDSLEKVEQMFHIVDRQKI